eukprot:GFUD01135109.1.p1 GENE.GFUD01135109.1~~GFUD01135109.1.p1  ORF type:complete len:329 (+),score=92.08 GFUD01135109.1:251-1237(+)
MAEISSLHHVEQEVAGGLNDDSGGLSEDAKGLSEDTEGLSDAASIQKEMLPSLALASASSAWDPANCPQWDMVRPLEHCFMRIKRDMMTIFKEPPPGMIIVPDEMDMTRIHALVTGPFDTPYEGGFFYFLLRCPPNYPISAPKVKLMTTGQGTVRFNPNFYKNGMICLSILGTWSGPSWSPALSLSSLLISIQSMMNDKPYHNEPGYEKERRYGDIERYNLIIQHETIRVAVLQNLDTESSCPAALCNLPPLFSVVRTSFPQFYEYYEDICKENVDRDGQTMRDPFGQARGTFQFQRLLDCLKRKKEELSEWFEEKEDINDGCQLSDT